VYVEDYEDLFGEQPELVTSGEPLSNYGAGRDLSTGLVLTYRKRLVFAVDPAARVTADLASVEDLAFVGVGGHLEPGEEWAQAAVREAREEANCDVQLADSAVTYFCRPHYAPLAAAWRWPSERPLLVWQAPIEVCREGVYRPVEFLVAVFRAAAMNPPQPAAEIPTLLIMTPEALVATYLKPHLPGELEELGVEVIGSPLPAERRVAPAGSAYFYAQWLSWQGVGVPEG
jgi:8-oxo-dGTP pyrophosphatase MutT (NUDIX family)